MKGPKHANMLQEPICVEVLVITVFLWAAIWGFLDLLAERLESDARRACFYCVFICNEWGDDLGHAGADDVSGL